MSNGAAIAHLPLPEPLEVAAPEPIEAEIGKVVADAAVAVALGMEIYRCHGALDPAGKKASAEALAALAQLQLDNLEIAAAVVEGRQVLNQRHGATLMRQLNMDAAGLDRVLDFFIAPAVEIASKGPPVNCCCGRRGQTDGLWAPGVRPKCWRRTAG